MSLNGPLFNLYTPDGLFSVSCRCGCGRLLLPSSVRHWVKFHATECVAHSNLFCHCFSSSADLGESWLCQQTQETFRVDVFVSVLTLSECHTTPVTCAWLLFRSFFQSRTVYLQKAPVDVNASLLPGYSDISKGMATHEYSMVYPASTSMD